MVLGFGSVMKRKGPVFTGSQKDKGYQPSISFDFSNYPRLRRALGYLGLLSTMQTPYNPGKPETRPTVFGGPEGTGIQPRPVIQYGKIKEEAGAAGTTPAPPPREGSAFPGYILDRDHAFSY